MNNQWKKMPLLRVLLVAGALASGVGLAQAQSFDSPQRAGEASTMTHGAPNLLTDNSPGGEPTMVLTSPALVAGSSPITQSWTDQDGSTTHVTTQTHVMGAGPAVVATTPAYPPVHHGLLAETSNIPLRAGEASSMTGGAPNMLTQNPVTVTSHPGPVYWYGF